MAMFTSKIDDTTELVLLETRHADELFALIDTSREHLRYWLPWIENEKAPTDTQAFIRNMLFKFAGGTDMLLGIAYEGRLAGTISLHDIDTHIGTAEVAYWLGAGFEGKGLMTKAAIAALDYAYNDLGLNRLQIRVEPANNRSRAIPRRLGFHFEGTLRQIAQIGDRRADLELYSMLKSEWETRRPRPRKDGDYEV